MPEDVNDQVAETTEAEEPELVHDDIVKRLLDYQRQLREGLEETSTDAASAASSVATQTATDELVDLTGGDTLEEDFVDLTEDVSGAPRPAEDMTIEDVAVASPPPPPLDDSAVDTPTLTTGGAEAPARDRADAEVIVLHPDPSADQDAMTSASDAAVARSDAPSDEAGRAGAWPGPAPSPARVEDGSPSVTTASSDDDAADRIVELERRLEILVVRFADLRSSFQDMAIAADERLAEIEDLLTEVRDDG